jgi:hypothetical protein
MLFSYAIEGFLGWLSRFKLIRLRRISLATLRRDGTLQSWFCSYVCNEILCSEILSPWAEGECMGGLVGGG